MTTMMRAVVVDRPGPPEVLTLRKVPRPTVREGWTLIQVKGFGLKAETADPARGQRGGCGHERDGPSTAPCRGPSTASPGEPTGSTRTGSSAWRKSSRHTARRTHTPRRAGATAQAARQGPQHQVQPGLPVHGGGTPQRRLHHRAADRADTQRPEHTIYRITDRGRDECQAPSRPLGGASGQVSKACPLGPGSSSAAQVPDAICQRSRKWPGVGHGDQFAVFGGSCEFETLSVWRAAAAQCYLRGGMFCLPRV
jgi:hypothetical protein